MHAMIEVWCIPTNLTAPEIVAASSVLTSSENMHAAYYRFPGERRRFVARRAARRLILADRTGMHPSALRFVNGPKGKPALENVSNVVFSTSHSGDLALVALVDRDDGPVGEIGVDIELLRPIPESDRLAEHFGSAAEYDIIRNTPPEARSEVFLRYWAVKEAWLKATGTGLGSGLAKLRVTLYSESAAELSDDSDVIHPVALFQPQLGYVAALAHTSNTSSVTCRTFDWVQAQIRRPVCHYTSGMRLARVGSMN